VQHVGGRRFGVKVLILERKKGVIYWHLLNILIIRRQEGIENKKS